MALLYENILEEKKTIEGTVWLSSAMLRLLMEFVFFL